MAEPKSTTDKVAENIRRVKAMKTVLKKSGWPIDTVIKRGEKGRTESESAPE